MGFAETTVPWLSWGCPQDWGCRSCCGSCRLGRSSRRTSCSRKSFPPTPEPREPRDRVCLGRNGQRGRAESARFAPRGWGDDDRLFRPGAIVPGHETRIRVVVLVDLNGLCDDGRPRGWWRLLIGEVYRRCLASLRRKTLASVSAFLV